MKSEREQLDALLKIRAEIARLERELNTLAKEEKDEPVGHAIYQALNAGFEAFGFLDPVVDVYFKRLDKI